MPKEVLIVHESQLMRKIVASHALAEFNDILVEAAISAEWGLTAIQRKKFDLVLSALDMQGIDGLELYRRMRSSEKNSDTAYIILAAEPTEDQRQMLFGKGIEHILETPYSVEDFAEVINRAVDLRSRRNDARYCIPGTEACLFFNGLDVTARVKNISINAIVIEMETPENYGICLDAVMLDLSFAQKYGGLNARGILTSVMRLDVIERRDNYAPKLVRVVRRFEQTPDDARLALENTFDQADQDLRLSEIGSCDERAMG